MKHSNEFEFIANHPALDFINTVENRMRSEPEDLITSYDDLLQWMVSAELLNEDGRATLQRECADQQEACRVALDEARHLREALWQIFGAIAKAEPPSDRTVNELNRILSLGPYRKQVQIAQEGQAATTKYVRDSEARIWPVIIVAGLGADLLSSGRLDRIRMCARDVCGDLFYDTSKSGKRRWCDMSKCGNRAKIDRYRQRT